MSSYVLPKDQMVMETLAEYRDFFILTGREDEAEFYRDLWQKIEQEQPIDSEVLLFLVRVTSSKVFNASRFTKDDLEVGLVNDEYAAVFQKHSKTFRVNATYLIGFIAIHTDLWFEH